MAALTYMGTKRRLADTIAVLCAELPRGPFFDLFSGISAAGAAVAPSRQVWCNDAQHFSKMLTEALYLSKENQPRTAKILAAVLEFGDQNFNALIRRAKPLVDKEFQLLGSSDAEEQIALQAELRTACQTWTNQGIWRTNETHCLFTISYAGSYLGLIQAMQIDSIRGGIDRAFAAELITFEERRWAIIALCRALAATSNSTGHFAQYLTPSLSNVNRVLSKRRRCAWSYWTAALDEMRPLRDQTWRLKNKIFQGDAIEVLRLVNKSKVYPGIIYADPPYTDDQYSRYYHLFETLILYDYPSLGGKGMYRADRFRSTFSVSRKVAESFELMIQEASKAGSSLMISYPSNGLLPNSLSCIPALLKRYYPHVRDPIIIPYQHSTLGASKGRVREDVEECIFIASHKSERSRSSALKSKQTVRC